MQDDLVTLATYRFALQAEVARVALEQEGIHAVIADSNLVTTNFFLGNAVGYIKLQSPRSQAKAALAILQRQPNLLDRAASSTADADDDGVVRCLSCNAIIPDDSERCSACGWCYGGEDSEDDA